MDRQQDHEDRRSAGHSPDIVVGIVGGLLGGWLLSLFGVDVKGGGLIFSFLTCLAGSCILLWIVGLVRGRGRSRV